MREELQATQMRNVELQAEVTALGADLEACRDELAEALKLVDLQKEDLDRYEKAIASAMPHCPERTDDDQLQLAWARILADRAEPREEPDADGSDSDDPLSDMPAPGSRDDEKDGEKKRPRRRGRRLLDPSKLPLKVIELDPPEVLAVGGAGFRLIGVETSSRIGFRASAYIQVKVVRRKWARIGQGPAVQLATGLSELPLPPVVIADIPECLWPRYMADPSAIANVIVSKYGDILPLNRQQTISKRHGFELPRSTQCDWLRGAYDNLYRIVDAMHADALARAHCIASDATGARVKSDGDCDWWHVFVLVADGDHVIFRHAKEHSSATALSLFKGFGGYLLADATRILDVVYREQSTTEVGCWSHLRRYGWKAIETERDRAYEMLALISQVFAIERACKEMTPAARLEARQARAGPVVKALDDWVDKHRDQVEQPGRMRAAITYYDNQRDALQQFLRDGRLAIHNNESERQLRNLVLGRSAWMYFANETGLKWYTVFRSLIASCLLHGLNPQLYLEQVLRLAPHWPVTRMLELSPLHWKHTLASLDERQKAILTPVWELDSQLVSDEASAAA